jgi:ATP/maltotriose-dependent transcriptional regulator MalT
VAEQADDQRAAEAREWLAAKAKHAARRRDQAGAAAALAELDRLRAELAEAREAIETAEEDLAQADGRAWRLCAAGDALARAAAQVSEDINDRFEFLSEILDDGVHEWRQATDPEYANARLGRSVRGDAPTEPPADPQPVNADLRDRLRTYPGDGDRQAPTDTEEQR